MQLNNITLTNFNRSIRHLTTITFNRNSLRIAITILITFPIHQILKHHLTLILSFKTIGKLIKTRGFIIEEGGEIMAGTKITIIIINLILVTFTIMDTQIRPIHLNSRVIQLNSRVMHLKTCLVVISGMNKASIVKTEFVHALNGLSKEAKTMSVHKFQLKIKNIKGISVNSREEELIVILDIEIGSFQDLFHLLKMKTMNLNY